MSVRPFNLFKGGSARCLTAQGTLICMVFALPGMSQSEITKSRKITSAGEGFAGVTLPIENSYCVDIIS